jgi:hypothetical protein
MKIGALVALVCAETLAGPSAAQAQTSHTNAVLLTTFSLTAYVQESNDTNSPVWTTSSRKFGNADIINALATDYGLPTNNFTPASLVLLARDVLEPTNFHLSFFLRSATDDVDVSTNIDANIPNDVGTVSTVIPAPFGRSTNDTSRSIMVLTLDTTNVSFSIQGPVRLDSKSIVFNNKVVSKQPFTTLLTATVAGAGKIDGKDAVFTGTVKTAQRTIEVKTSP